MVGRTLHEIRAEIERLADGDGRYCLVCARTGERPYPVADRRFGSRSDAADAALLAERYRAALRRYDPRVRCYDLVACEAPALLREPFADGDAAGVDRADNGSDPEATARSGAAAGDAAHPGRPPDWLGSGRSPYRFGGRDGRTGGEARIEFCHRTAGAVFETLQSTGHADVETAVMDAYVEAAETVRDPDDLCLRLLDRMAAELDDRLTATEQATVLSAAAARLPLPQFSGRDALVAVFDRLAAVGLLTEYDATPWSTTAESPGRSRTVRVSDYALQSPESTVVTLPITVAYLRRRPEARLSVLPATRLDGGAWEVTVSTAPDANPAGLTRVPFADDSCP